MKCVSPNPPRLDRRVPRRRRVIALVGDTQVGLWVVRSLARNGLKVFAVVRSRHGQAAHSRYCSGAWILESRVGSDAFIDELAALVRHVDAGSIMTISEGYHAALIGGRGRFEPDVHIFSPPAECFQKATDKDYMHGLCERLGVPVARGTTLEALLAGKRRLAYPLVLRTRRQGDPSRLAPWKAAYAADRKQLLKLTEQVADFTDNVLVQEYHPGAEDHIQILMHEGRPFMVGEYIGEHHMPLAGGVTVRRITCRHEPLIRDAVRLLQALGWQGMAGAQFHYDPATGKYIFLEINPRFIGGLPTVILAGFEAPFLLWQSHFEPHRMRRGRYQIGLRSRILGGDANWMFGMIRGDQLPPDQKHVGALRAVGSFLWNFGPWTKDDTFALMDVKPALVDFVQMARRLGAESMDIIGNPQTQETPS